MVDVRDGILRQDQIVADKLRRTNKPVFLAVNKSDNARWSEASTDFYEFGLTSPYPISCTQNLGFDSLMEDLLQQEHCYYYQLHIFHDLSSFF